MTNFLIKLFVKDKSNQRTSYGKLAGFTGIVCNIVLFIIKITAGIFSGSIAIVADAVNNLMDMASSVVTLIGFKLSSKPADKEHPFGHGRMEYMSGFLVSCIIVVVGVELFRSSVDKLVNPQTATSANLITVIILIISILVKLWLYIFNRKIGKEILSSVLIATAKDSLYDVVATTSVLLSAVVLMVFSVDIDAYVGIVISLFIAYGGIKSAIQTISPLLGEPPSAELVTEIKEIILNEKTFIGIHDLVIHNYGPDNVFVSVHVEIPDDMNIVVSHEKIDHCEREIERKTGAKAVIHTDPISNDKNYTKIKDELFYVIKSVGEELTLHDLHVYNRGEKIDLIFDIVLPSEQKDENKIVTEITEKMQSIDNKYNCIIAIDKSFE